MTQKNLFTVASWLIGMGFLVIGGYLWTREAEWLYLLVWAVAALLPLQRSVTTHVRVTTVGHTPLLPS